MRVLIIGNPIAGVGRAGRRVGELGRLLQDRGCEVTTRLTRGSGDARAFAESVGGDVDCLVIAGGDGTIHEAVNGLADPSGTPIAILGVGTANLLARDLDLPRTPHGVADLIQHGRTRMPDPGLIGGERRFFAVASAGLDAMVIRALHGTRRGALGFGGYPLPILKAISRYRPPRLRVSVEGGRPVEGAWVVVANTFTYAGFLSVADRARCDSGRLDVVVFPRGSLPALARYAWAGWRRRVSKLTGVSYLTGVSVRIDSSDPVDVEVDGEYYGVTPIDIALQTAAAPVLTLVSPGSTARLGSLGGAFDRARDTQ